jgi:hypothetical protein
MVSEHTDTGAEAVAVQALGWIAGNSEMLSRFLAITGIEAGDIRRAASEQGFMAGVLDFLLAHEPSLMAFCGDTETAPETVQKARRHLGPSTDTVWTST